MQTLFTHNPVGPAGSLVVCDPTKPCPPPGPPTPTPGARVDQGPILGGPEGGLPYDPRFDFRVIRGQLSTAPIAAQIRTAPSRAVLHTGEDEDG